MAYKNLLVHLDPSKSSAKRADAAVALAAKHGAHLTALAAAPTPSVPSYVEAQIPAAVFEQARAALMEGLDEIGATFEKKAKAAGISYEFRKELAQEPLADLISRHSRYADLAILGQSDPDDPMSADPELSEDVILACGRPVLMIPYIGVMQEPGKKIVVAWDAGREAARAVNDAMPLLEAADQVVVLIVHPKRGA
jgi:nucleotide-binding universal stress UspA family protein